jgi:hypothetical protein
MRFLRCPGEPRRSLEPTPSEAYVQEEFGEAIAFASRDWQRLEATHREADRSWAEKFTLKQRLLAFLEGPIVPNLQEHYPKIAAIGAEADAATETSRNALVICRLIVGEAVVACGSGTRGQMRSSLPD